MILGGTTGTTTFFHRWTTSAARNVESFESSFRQGRFQLSLGCPQRMPGKQAVVKGVNGWKEKPKNGKVSQKESLLEIVPYIGEVFVFPVHSNASCFLLEGEDAATSFQSKSKVWRSQVWPMHYLRHASNIVWQSLGKLKAEAMFIRLDHIFVKIDHRSKRSNGIHTIGL